MPSQSPDDTASTVPADAPESTTISPGAAEAVAAATEETHTPEASLDSDLLNNANGDSAVWGAEFGRFLAALTGSHIDDASLAAIFGAYALQVQVTTYRQAAIAVANSPITNSGQPANVLIAQMDLRGDIAEYLLQTAG
jgi:hypothetical protein